jgi:hypothetical protein
MAILTLSVKAAGDRIDKQFAIQQTAYQTRPQVGAIVSV